MTTTLFILLVIFTSFIFDFINGFHDAANSIATIVTTDVLTPKQAVLWAAFFNFIAFMIFNLAIAKTIGNGLIDPMTMNPIFIFAALIGAISWNILTWYYGLPSSSSHALIGGLIGAALAKSGIHALQLSGLIKVLTGIIIAPALGLITGLLLIFIIQRIAKNFIKKKFNKTFKILQLISSAFLSLTHGGNDAQKTMGIIAMLLFSASWLHGEFYIPFWVIISCQAVISLGTFFGGWRIVDTLGKQITKLNPASGCAAETGSAIIIFFATQYGIPISTTHTLTGAITGVGMIHGIKSTRWHILRQIFFSWILTIPATATLSALIILLFK